MQSQFLTQFYDQLFKIQLISCGNSQPLFYYIDVITNVCKRIKQVCNNSRIAILVFCDYLVNRLMVIQLEMPSNVEHELLKSLKIQENYVIYFTQIAIRIILLNYLCKVGQQKKRKQWKISLYELFKQAKIEFMFNYHDSLATVFADLILKIEQVCNQMTFYQKLIKLFDKQDLDYVAEKIRDKINKNKQNWRANINNNKDQLTPKPLIKNTQSCLKTAEKVAINPRKSIKITATQKAAPDENLKRRISDYRQNQKRRLSQHHQSGRRRTIYQQRKYMTKNSIDSQSQQFDQFIFFDQEETKDQAKYLLTQQINQKQKKPETQQYGMYEPQLKKSVNKNRNTSKDQLKIDINNKNFAVAGTPPKLLKNKKSPQRCII